PADISSAGPPTVLSFFSVTTSKKKTREPPLRVAARRPVVKRRDEAYGKAFPTADRGLKLSVPPGRRVEAGLSRLQVPAPLNPHARALKIGARKLISKVVEAVVKALVAWWN